MTMHLAQGLSTINTKKRKVKITKKKMAELQEQWRKHNKTMKQKHMHEFCYENFNDYIDYAFGRIKKPDPRDYKYFKPMRSQTNWRAEQDKLHREKYPSLEMSKVDNGRGRKKESPKYTGTLVKGIATMHKSNAVPVIDDQHAKDIARMRR